MVTVPSQCTRRSTRYNHIDLRHAAQMAQLRDTSPKIHDSEHLLPFYRDDACLQKFKHLFDDLRDVGVLWLKNVNSRPIIVSGIPGEKAVLYWSSSYASVWRTTIRTVRVAGSVEECRCADCIRLSSSWAFQQRERSPSNSGRTQRSTLASGSTFQETVMTILTSLSSF